MFLSEKKYIHKKNKRMKNIILSIVFALTGVAACAKAPTHSINSKDQQENSSEVIVMDRALFIEKVFDYESMTDWQYKGDKPAIIDLYADWCGPCRKVAPIMKELAKEYEGEIIIYKVNVDKEKELAAIFNASSIPLFVFIPMTGTPQLFKGAADKTTYKNVIDQFLLGKEK